MRTNFVDFSKNLIDSKVQNGFEPQKKFISIEIPKKYADPQKSLIYIYIYI